MEAHEPPVQVYGEEPTAENGKEFPLSSANQNSASSSASVLSAEQLKKIEKALSSGPMGSLEAVDVDTATELLVDLRPDVSQEQIDELMERFDVGFLGHLQKAQVAEAAEALCQYELEKEQLCRAFRLFDRDDNGFISVDDLKNALQGGEDGLSTDELLNFLTLSGCKTETCFDYRKFVEHVADGPVILRAAAKGKKGKGKKG